MAAQANGAGERAVESLRAEIERLRTQLVELQTGIEQERSKKIVNRVMDAAQGTKALKREIEQLRIQLVQANKALA